MTEDDRRSFSSRTPHNENPDRVVYRRGFVTRHQVSGWRFVMRRIASGVALHDARMLVDPLRSQTRAVLVGALLVITGLLGCFVFSLIRPAGDVGDSVVVADRSTSALYVRIGDRLHPVLNLASARLIAGEPVDPTSVSSRQLDQYPRGNLVGIPGAPERLVQSTVRDSDWTVCDAVGGQAPGVTVIAGAPVSGSGRAALLSDDSAVLAASPDGTWLLWDGRRSRLDPANGAVTGALGFGGSPRTPRPIDVGLLNAIPESPPMVAPEIPDAGQPPAFELPVPAPVGAVVAAHAPDGSLRYFVVLRAGLQQISPVVATLLRNANSHGIANPPRLSADQISRAPSAPDVIDTSRYPATELKLVDASSAPVTCVRSHQSANATGASVTLLSGAALPIADSARPVDLVGGGTGGVANRVALPPGTGYYVQGSGGAFWLSDTGVRYGIDDTDNTDAAGALGLSLPPVPIPPAVLPLFAAGPTLSSDDALLAHDALPPDSRPGRRVQEHP